MNDRHALDPASPVAPLAELFRTHPVWRAAARYLEDGATSDIYFTSEPGAVWHLERRGDETHLCLGAAAEPDLIFRFTPEAVASLARTDGDIGDFAVRLFHLMVEVAPDRGVALRIVAPFSRLVRRGYLSLLVAGGLRVLAFGTAHGVRTLRDLRRVVEKLQHSPAAEWEVGASGAIPRLLESPGLHLRMRRVGREIAAQHDRLREIVAEINAALAEGDGQGALDSAARYRDALEAHFALEENVIFPALQGADPGSAAEIEGFLQEHVSFFDQARSLVDSGADARSADWRARFYALRRALAIHEAREEGVVNAETGRST